MHIEAGTNPSLLAIQIINALIYLYKSHRLDSSQCCSNVYVETKKITIVDHKLIKLNSNYSKKTSNKKTKTKQHEESQYCPLIFFLNLKND